MAFFCNIGLILPNDCWQGRARAIQFHNRVDMVGHDNIFINTSTGEVVGYCCQSLCGNASKAVWFSRRTKYTHLIFC